MQKHANTQNQKANSEPLDYVTIFKNKLPNLEVKELNLMVKQLNYLCLNYDPYNMDDKSIEVKNILNQFKLNEFAQSPFGFTNILLQLLDKLDNEIKRRIH
ncbi:MAG: hypothetical protein N4A33_06090 [Bacteriovoracaceae bacterium]|jgi:hypothetical protein|nr:hypothetical protein [Bacteriovoracaceae bacterium]